MKHFEPRQLSGLFSIAAKIVLSLVKCYSNSVKREIILVLHNIRSTYNVGAILRTADGLGVERVVYSGYTPRYNDDGLLPHLREKLNRQIGKAALGAELTVAQESVKNLQSWLGDQRQAGYEIVGLENNLSDAEIERRQILQAGLDLGTKIVLVLGEEVEGIPEELRAQMDYFLEIPMYGQKESFNVSVATGIALWGLKNL